MGVCMAGHSEKLLILCSGFMEVPPLCRRIKIQGLEIGFFRKNVLEKKYNGAEGVGQIIWHLSGMCEALGVISITVPKFFYKSFFLIYIM